MSSYWPSGLDLSDTSSPLEILQAAEQDWSQESKGLLSLVIQEAKSTSGHQMLIVHAKHVPTNRTVTLFSVVHRLGAPYPANIQTRDDELPDFLKKSYYRPGLVDVSMMRGISAMTGGREVENKWVCDTPSDLRAKLREVFNLGAVKSDILNLVSGAKSSLLIEDGAGPKENTVEEQTEEHTS